MDTETAQTLPMRRMSHRQLYGLINPLIDVLSDPASKQEQPEEWAEAYVELARILRVPGNWETIETIGEGSKTNFIQHNLGPFRMRFLRAFHEQTRR